MFSLYNVEVDGYSHEDVRYGSNCVPAFRTTDLESERERISQFAEIETEYELDDHAGFLFRDPSGNLLEVYKMFD